MVPCRAGSMGVHTRAALRATRCLTVLASARWWCRAPALCASCFAFRVSGLSTWCLVRRKTVGTLKRVGNLPRDCFSFTTRLPDGVCVRRSGRTPLDHHFFKSWAAVDAVGTFDKVRDTMINELRCSPTQAKIPRVVRSQVLIGILANGKRSSADGPGVNTGAARGVGLGSAASTSWHGLW